VLEGEQQAPRTRVGDPNRQSDWTPRPDPTALTTEALHREIAALKSLMDERLKGMDDLIDEKFASINHQFALVERQRVEQKGDSERAISAALQAAKDAVQDQTTASEKAINKSENAIAKQLEQLGATFSAAFEGIRRDIDSLLQRVTVLEAVKVGGRDASTAIYALAGFVLVLLLIGGVIALKGPA
jgi:hypothetical protein